MNTRRPEEVLFLGGCRGPQLARRHRADRIAPLKGARGLGSAMLNLRFAL
ncbi:hypothetical protein E1H18_3915 [Caulobacter sp. RHG1]|nr:hypothetical protein [Caulobacter sp. RHG1]